jgi:hypothetical protein
MFLSVLQAFVKCKETSRATTNHGDGSLRRRSVRQLVAASVALWSCTDVLLQSLYSGLYRRAFERCLLVASLAVPRAVATAWWDDFLYLSSVVAVRAEAGARSRKLLPRFFVGQRGSRY